MTPGAGGAETSSRSATAEKKIPKKTEPAARPILIKPVPMKPRRGLFVLLLIVFVCWVGWLVAMYFTMVRPLEHEEPTSAPALASSFR